MKRIVSALLVFLLIFSYSACKDTAVTSSEEVSGEVSSDISFANDFQGKWSTLYDYYENGSTVRRYNTAYLEFYGTFVVFSKLQYSYIKAPNLFSGKPPREYINHYVYASAEYNLVVENDKIYMVTEEKDENLPEKCEIRLNENGEIELIGDEEIDVLGKYEGDYSYYTFENRIETPKPQDEF